MHSALICSKIQVYEVMVEYNNPPFNQAHFKSLMNFFAFSQWGVGLCFEPHV